MSELQLSQYRWPAEWEPHAATWLAWPVNPNTWPGIFERIPAAFARFVAAIARFEPVRVLVAAGETTEQARALVDAACEDVGAAFPAQMVDIPINDSWCRDYGPMFLNRVATTERTREPPNVAKNGNGVPAQVIIDWDYNAWGGKYPPWDRDAAVAGKIAEHLGLPTVRPGIILEGGAVEGNGCGTVLTTENCLLNPNRNPGLSRSDVEGFLQRFLQARNVVWLPGHGIIGDDTDGHIDQVARFADDRRVLVASPYDDDAPEAAALRENRDAVAAGCNADGDSLEAIDLKMPSPKFQQGHRLPACYCNYYLVNSGVVVPTYTDAADDDALQLLQTLYPQRKVIGVDAIDLIWGLGAFHCMTQ
ncbi:MAG: agmatine deiminase family protein, partial [Planctomycetaceae bacterium]|nr:agmatine deiminase family protein [Planctomycetaceae bacterium]